MTIRLVTLGDLGFYQDGHELPSLRGQPMRAALLVYMAVERQVTRDDVLSILWPDKGRDRARSSLNSTLHELGKSLPDGWRTRRGDFIECTDLVSADAVQFQRAVDSGDDERALALYTGPFLDAAHLAGTRTFEAWVDRRRSHLARLHRQLRSRAVTARVEAGDLEEALELAQEWAELEPFEDEAHHRCVELLAEMGRPAQALLHFERFRARLAEALELEPVEDTLELVERIRARRRPSAEAEAEGSDGSPGNGSAVSPPPGSAPGAAPVGDDRPSGPAPGPEEPETDSLAVLPFVNMSPDPENEYFSDGMTEELISALSRIEGLKLASATSSFALKGQSLDVREIRKLLSVDRLVEGSVRKAGHDLRISARLVDAHDGYELWSGSWDRKLKDVFAVQNEIAVAICDALDPHLPRRRDRAPRPQTGNAEAYDLYLLGRYFYATRRPEALERAIGYFREALELDPDYALAYSGLGDVYLAQAHLQYRAPREVMEAAQEVTARALELNPNLAEAHCTAAHVDDTFTWRWHESERGYRRAIELDPTYAHARITYADFLTALGRHEESRLQGDRAELLEPLSVPIKFQRGSQRYRARAFDEARSLLDRALEMAPAYFPARVFQVLNLVALGRAEEAAETAGSALAQFGPMAALLMVRGYALAALGKDAEAAAVVERLREQGRAGFVPTLMTALVEGARGRIGPGLEGLRRAVEERNVQLSFLAVDPAFDPFRDDPRFHEILEALGLGDRDPPPA